MTGDVVLDALAAYRITRLITADVLSAPIRQRVIEAAYRHADALSDLSEQRRPGAAETWDDLAQHDPEAPKLATLVTCRWCTGVYVAAGVVAARRLAPRLWAPVAEAAALAAGAALLARFEDD